jgi:hypothetical protein
MSWTERLSRHGYRLLDGGLALLFFHGVLDAVTEVFFEHDEGDFARGGLDRLYLLHDV